MTRRTRYMIRRLSIESEDCELGDASVLSGRSMAEVEREHRITFAGAKVAGHWEKQMRNGNNGDVLAAPARARAAGEERCASFPEGIYGDIKEQDLDTADEETL